MAATKEAEMLPCDASSLFMDLPTRSPIELKKANLHTSPTSAFRGDGSPGSLPSIWPQLLSLFIYTFPAALLSVDSKICPPLVTDPPWSNRCASTCFIYFFLYYWSLIQGLCE